VGAPARPRPNYRVASQRRPPLLLWVVSLVPELPRLRRRRRRGAVRPDAAVRLRPRAQPTATSARPRQLELDASRLHRHPHDFLVVPASQGEPLSRLRLAYRGRAA
jgi:hypothetical protein